VSSKSSTNTIDSELFYSFFRSFVSVFFQRLRSQGVESQKGLSRGGATGGGGFSPPSGMASPPPSGNCAVFVGDRLLAKLLPISVVI
jgi:hypothetical protein